MASGSGSTSLKDGLVGCLHVRLLCDWVDGRAEGCLGLHERRALRIVRVVFLVDCLRALLFRAVVIRLVVVLEVADLHRVPV